MAILIPNTLPIDAPDSEKRVFNTLKSDKNSDELIVFHSIGLSQRGRKKPYGEIDFVILIPKLGVICLEVKGGGVSCKDGEWQTINRFNNVNKLKKSPFIQVREGMASLRNAVNDRHGNLFQKCFFCTLVVFPDVEAPPRTPEFEIDEVIDIDDLGPNIFSIIQSKIKSQKKRMGWEGMTSLSEASDVKILTQYLRPNFELKVLRSSRIRRDVEDLVVLTEEQAQLIEGCIDNSRCLVKGAAGTGKTMMAIEAVKIKSVEKLNIGFFCYNKVFGGWLQREISSQGIQNIRVGSIYETLVDLIRNSSFYAQFCVERNEILDRSLNDVFEKLIPKYAIAAIQEIGDELDYLILDEGQDLIKPELLDVFDVWLRGGLRNGSWLIVGDFCHQAIYSNQDATHNLIETLEKYTSHYFNFKLTLNCRNTKNIAETTALYSGFENMPYRVNQIEGEPVNRSFCETKEVLSVKLHNQIKHLLDEGVSPSDITILSSKTFKDSIVSSISKYNILDISNSSTLIPDRKDITFSTIHSFKGLESPVVIVTDIEGIVGHYNRSLLYIAMSRASSYLSVLMNENVRLELKEIMSKTLKGQVL